MISLKFHSNMETPKSKEIYTNLSSSQNSYTASEKPEIKSEKKFSINHQKKESEKNLAIKNFKLLYSLNSTNPKTQEIKDEKFLQHKRNTDKKSDELLTCHQCKKMEFNDNCLICINVNCKRVYCYKCLEKYKVIYNIIYYRTIVNFINCLPMKS